MRVVASLAAGTSVAEGSIAAAADPIPARATVPKMSEPLGIVVDAAREIHAREWFERVRTGTIDRAQLDPDLATSLAPDVVARVAGLVGAFGAPLEWRAVETRVTAQGTADRYRVRFASRTLTWIYKTGPRGINGLTLRHSVRDTVFRAILFDRSGY